MKIGLEAATESIRIAILGGPVGLETLDTVKGFPTHPEDWMNDDASVQVPHLRRAPRL